MREANAAYSSALEERKPRAASLTCAQVACSSAAWHITASAKHVSASVEMVRRAAASARSASWGRRCSSSGRGCSACRAPTPRCGGWGCTAARAIFAPAGMHDRQLPAEVAVSATHGIDVAGGEQIREPGAYRAAGAGRARAAAGGGGRRGDGRRCARRRRRCCGRPRRSTASLSSSPAAGKPSSDRRPDSATRSICETASFWCASPAAWTPAGRTAGRTAAARDARRVARAVRGRVRVLFAQAARV